MAADVARSLVITVTVHSASNLAVGDTLTRSSDPFCIVSAGGKQDQTKVVKKNLNPTWEETFQFSFGAGDTIPPELSVIVKDWDAISKSDTIGTATVPLASISSRGVAHEIPALALTPKGSVRLTVILDESLVEAHAHKFVGVLSLHVEPAAGTAPLCVRFKFGSEIFNCVCKGQPIPPPAGESVWVDAANLRIDTVSQKFKVAAYAARGTAFNKSDSLLGSQLITVADLLNGELHEIPLVLQEGLDVDHDNELATADAFNATKINRTGHTVFAKFTSRQHLVVLLWHELVAVFDQDGSGNIDEEEFSALTSSIGCGLSDEDATALFEKIDAAKAGSVSFAQIADFATQGKGLGLRILRCPISGENLSSMTEEEALNTVAMNLAKNRGKLSDLGNAFLFAPSYLTKADKPGAVTKGGVYDIDVQDRDSGLIVREHIPTYIKTGIRMLYRSKLGRASAKTAKVKAMLTTMTVKAGLSKDKPESKNDIQAFIREHNLLVADILEPIESFNTFNEFFYRRLKPDARPIASPFDPRVVVSPADCRLNAFDTLPDAMNIWIKGVNFSLPNLVNEDTDLFAKFRSGSIMIARLAPQDYHRVHLPIDCTIVRTKDIGGTYYTVSPFAVKADVDVYTENRRTLIEMSSPIFGTVLAVMVGATMVGSIRLCVEVGKSYSKGDELGYFAFGGSTVLLLFENGAVAFDRDLIENSKRPIETLVKMGTCIGIKTAQPVTEAGAPPPAPTTAPPPVIVITAAKYGASSMLRKRYVDVREQLQALVNKDGRILWPASFDYNSLAGDPIQGTKKELLVNFTVNGEAREMAGKEGEPFHLP